MATVVLWPQPKCLGWPCWWMGLRMGCRLGWCCAMWGGGTRIIPWAPGFGGHEQPLTHPYHLPQSLAIKTSSLAEAENMADLIDGYCRLQGGLDTSLIVFPRRGGSSMGPYMCRHLPAVDVPTKPHWQSIHAPFHAFLPRPKGLIQSCSIIHNFPAISPT